MEKKSPNHALGERAQARRLNHRLGIGSSEARVPLCTQHACVSVRIAGVAKCETDPEDAMKGPRAAAGQSWSTVWSRCDTVSGEDTRCSGHGNRVEVRCCGRACTRVRVACTRVRVACTRACGWGVLWPRACTRGPVTNASCNSSQTWVRLVMWSCAVPCCRPHVPHTRCPGGRARVRAPLQCRSAAMSCPVASVLGGVRPHPSPFALASGAAMEAESTRVPILLAPFGEFVGVGTAPVRQPWHSGEWSGSRRPVLGHQRPPDPRSMSRRGTKDGASHADAAPPTPFLVHRVPLAAGGTGSGTVGLPARSVSDRPPCTRTYASPRARARVDERSAHAVPVCRGVSARAPARRWLCLRCLRTACARPLCCVYSPSPRIWTSSE